MEKSAAEKTNNRGRRGKFKYFILVLLLLTIAGAGYWYFFLFGNVYSDDARIGGEMVDLAPQISGTLVEVYVHEGDKIRKNQPVFMLYKKPYQAALSKARATLAQLETALQIARTKYAKAKHGARKEEIQILETTWKKAAVQLKYAKKNYQRIKILFKKKLATREALEQAESTWKVARRTFEEAYDRLKLLRSGTRKEDLVLAAKNISLVQRQKKAAEIAVEQARINLDMTVVKAPFKGVVVKRWQDPGGVVTAGRSVVTLFNPSDIHVDANIEEKYLNRIKVGNPVDISVDACPGDAVKGRVTSILPAANSQFSLIPSEGVSGTFIKVSQRLPIRIAFDQLPACPLGPGLSVEVTIHHRPVSRLPSLAIR